MYCVITKNTMILFASILVLFTSVFGSIHEVNASTKCLEYANSSIECITSDRTIIGEYLTSGIIVANGAILDNQGHITSVNGIMLMEKAILKNSGVINTKYLSTGYEDDSKLINTGKINTGVFLGGDKSEIINSGTILVTRTDYSGSISKNTFFQNNVTGITSILGPFENNGIIVNKGIISIDGEINNKNQIVSYGTLINFGIITNYGKFQNLNSMYDFDVKKMVYHGGSLTNRGTIINTIDGFHEISGPTINSEIYLNQGKLVINESVINTGVIYNFGKLECRGGFKIHENPINIDTTESIVNCHDYYPFKLNPISPYYPELEQVP